MAKQLPRAPFTTARPSRRVAQAKIETPVTPKSWRQKYLALTPRTRIIIGLGIMTYAGAALYLSDRAEDAFNLKATEEEKKRLNEMIPKIRTIDRPEST